MGLLLTGAQVADATRSFDQLGPGTRIELMKTGQATPIYADMFFKAIGPDYIDFGTNDVVIRVSTHDVFVYVYTNDDNNTVQMRYANSIPV